MTRQIRLTLLDLSAVLRRIRASNLDLYQFRFIQSCQVAPRLSALRYGVNTIDDNSCEAQR